MITELPKEPGTDVTQQVIESLKQGLTTRFDTSFSVDQGSRYIIEGLLAEPKPQKAWQKHAVPYRTPAVSLIERNLRAGPFRDTAALEKEPPMNEIMSQKDTEYLRDRFTEEWNEWYAANLDLGGCIYSTAYWAGPRSRISTRADMSRGEDKKKLILAVLRWRKLRGRAWRKVRRAHRKLQRDARKAQRAMMVTTKPFVLARPARGWFGEWCFILVTASAISAGLVYILDLLNL